MGSIVTRNIKKFRSDSLYDDSDLLIIEEPLELYLNTSPSPLLVTMRTPGEDFELTIGMLFTMNMISPNAIPHVIEKGYNHIRVRVKLDRDTAPSVGYMSSSCGICNSPSWDEITHHSLYPVYPHDFTIHSDFILRCKDLIASEDDHFSKTGGNHKVSLVTCDGQLLYESEDVGRHNAFDKVIGQCFLNKTLPLRNTVALLSGRCSYEMCQKAWIAGIPIVLSLGAPTSKAVELAEQVGITLVGFVKSKSFNIYSHPTRINS